MDDSGKGSMQVVNRYMRKNFRVLTVREMQVRALQHLTPVRTAVREKTRRAIRMWHKGGNLGQYWWYEISHGKHHGSSLET